MPFDPQVVAALKRRLAIKYANDLEGLKALGETMETATSQFVTITGAASEHSNSSGMLVASPLEWLDAIDEMIMKLDPNFDPPQQRQLMRFADYQYTTTR